MTTPSVRPDPPIEQPPTLPRMEFEAAWTTHTPESDAVEVQLWADRGRRDGEIRILDGLILGTVADVFRDKATLTPAPDAAARYGLEWVDAQLCYGQALLAKRLARR